MRKIVTLISSLLLASSSAMAFTGQKTFMPPNNLDQEDDINFDGGLTQAQFNSVIDRVMQVYGPIFTHFGATLTVDRRWTDSTVNASADQPTPTSWQVHMYGGLARRAEVTEDGFAMVICHELGHHLGGFPFVQDWAANEGQADIHATGACAAKIFATNLELSARAQLALPPEMSAKCDSTYQTENDRDLCYRGLVAGKSLADLLAAIGSESPVAFNTPDTTVVTRTNNDHPKAQCRLDTYVAGALCGANHWDYNLIPGKEMANRNSMEAQDEAYAHSCAEGEGARPSCWFAAVTNNPTPGGDCPIDNQAICDILCQFDPSQPWCAK